MQNLTFFVNLRGGPFPRANFAPLPRILQKHPLSRTRIQRFPTNAPDRAQHCRAGFCTLLQLPYKKPCIEVPFSNTALVGLARARPVIIDLFIFILGCAWDAVVVSQSPSRRTALLFAVVVRAPCICGLLTTLGGRAGNGKNRELFR